MLKTTAPVLIPLRSNDDIVRLQSVGSSKLGHHLDKPRRRKSKDRNRMSALWCASGQRSPTSSYESMPYDIPHLVRSVPPPAPPRLEVSNVPQQHPNGVPNHVVPEASSIDSGVDCKSSLGSEKEESFPKYGPARPPSGCTRPSSSKAPAQRNQPETTTGECSNAGNPARGSNPTVLSQKSRMSRSWSSFSLKTFAIRRKESPSRRLPVATPEALNDTAGARMEQSRKRVGGSMPGDDRLTLASASASADDEVVRKRTHTQVAERLSRLTRSFRRRRSTDRVSVDLKHHDSTGDSTSSSSSSSSTSSNHQAIILYGTASRCRRSSFKLPISISPSADSNGTTAIPDRSGRKSGTDSVYPGLPNQLSLADGVHLVKVLKLDQYMTNKWISGMAMSDKNELILVDLREAYLIDDLGNLIRTVGSKGSDRLIEPIGVSAGPEGRLVFTDHAQQNVKVYTSRGNHLRTITDFSLANIAGVACNRSTGEIFVAGTDRKRLFVHCDGETRTIPPERNSASSSTSSGSRVSFKHPFSVAYNAVSREIIVGDDYDQSVMGVSTEGQLMWRFCPQTHDGERQFFPSSVCVDQDGMVFVADLYNGKVCLLDSKGQFVRTLLSRGCGLSGNPGAIATDGKGHILVADEERTVKVFQYKRRC